MHKRLSWDEYFFQICEAVANRATCDRGKSGAVIAKNKRIIATGYVGSPMGLPHCDEAGHEFKDTVHEDGSVTKHCVRTTHAEQNAICQAARFGIAIDGSTLYCTMTPCYTCAKMIINSGIVRVVVQQDYQTSAESRRIFQEAGIKFEILDDKVKEYPTTASP